jgi:hypothetical protein
MPIPVTLEDAQIALRQGGEELDPTRLAEVQGFITDAAAWVEDYTGHILVARNVTEQFRGFGSAKLRAWPVAPTSAPGVAYLGENGEPIAVVGARLDVSRRPARVLPPLGPFYSFRDARQLFTVTIRAGYEEGDAIPGAIRRAMLILIAAYDADHEGGDLFGKAEATARALCDRANLRLRRV